MLESVQTSVYPKVIDCPPRGAAKPSLDAVAKDGIQLKVKARVTVRANLQQLIGGATEETITANNPLVMNIFSAVIPSLSLAEEELRWQSNKTKHVLEPLEFDQWLVSYVVDAEIRNWTLLFKWMAFISDNIVNHREHRDYAVDASLIVTSNYRVPQIEINFVDIWPSTLGEVSFSTREGDVQLESTVNFTYDYFTVNERVTTS